MKRSITVALALLCAAPSWAEDLVRVDAPWARATILASRPGAVYLTLTSTDGDRLVAMESPVADQVMLHATDQAEGISRMSHLETLELPPGQAVTLAPGGMHLMLMGLREKLVEGDSFPMTLRFEVAGELSVDVRVLGIAASGPEAAMRSGRILVAAARRPGGHRGRREPSRRRSGSGHGRERARLRARGPAARHRVRPGLADLESRIVVLSFVPAECLEPCSAQQAALAAVQAGVNVTPMREMVTFLTILPEPEAAPPAGVAGVFDAANWRALAPEGAGSVPALAEVYAGATRLAAIFQGADVGQVNMILYRLTKDHRVRERGFWARVRRASMIDGEGIPAASVPTIGPGRPETAAYA